MAGNAELPAIAAARAVPPSAWGLLAALSVTLLILALLWGPRTCERGTEDYLLAGIAALAAAFAAPVALARAGLWKRLALGIGFAAACLTVWVGGWMLGEFRLLCRLW
jgi:hypothetical protein